MVKMTYLSNISKIQSSLPVNTVFTMILSLVISHLNHCNSFIASFPILHLSFVLHCAVHIFYVCGEGIASLTTFLHFFLSILTGSSLLSIYIPSCSFHSAVSNLLVKPCLPPAVSYNNLSSIVALLAFHTTPPQLSTWFHL